MPRIALVSNTDFSLYNFRLGLIQELIARGYEVYVVCPNGEYTHEFTKMGIKCHPFYIDRKGTNPFNEARTLWQLYAIFRKGKFDIVHNFTVKPNIYGNIAAKFAGVPTVMNSVTGLGYVFTGDGRGKKLLRCFVVALYRFAFRFSKRVVFLNDDDSKLFVDQKIVNVDKVVVIRSEGVDTGKFSPSGISRERSEQARQELGISQEQRRLVVTLISRLLWDKGVREFVAAARTLRLLYPDALFLLVGPIDTGNPAAVSRDYLQQAEKEGIIKYLGERRDIPEILYISDIITLPSYREGIPRVLLEAMSMEKPIVTTDSVGCRDVVEEGKNGFLVPIKDHIALASAIERLLNDEELRIKMGKYGREKVLREFDERLIVSQTMEIYEGILRERI